MSKPMKIDFVSDISCPWCVIGLGALEAALDRVGDLVDAEIRFQPFELNPDLPPGGQNIAEHIAQKFGPDRKPSAEAREAMRARAAQFGFTMATSDASRIYNTFDAHRLLHWAGTLGRQRALKHALFEAYFSHGRDPGDRETLVETAAAVGLDPAAVREVLETDRYALEVRVAERVWREAGVNAVPSIVINDEYMITGGQPVETFERVIRTAAAQS
jgi:predicted DsbA family dithiol-disulfide isomerase